jgi:predicted dehydrogenase
MAQRLRVGVVGCGAISPLYLETMTRAFGRVLEVVGCSSRGGESARVRAAQYGIRAMDTGDLLADETIDLAVILTPAHTHAHLIRQALECGKHVYTEKPLATDARTAAELVSLARSRGLALACAPDTLLSAGVQTARQALLDGAVGRVTSVEMSMSRNFDDFYPRLPFLLLPGAGAGADLGPYFLTTAVYLLGPVCQVIGMADVSRPDRTAPDGTPYRVDNDNRFLALLRFAGGAVGSFHLNADAGGPEDPVITLYGTEGTLKLYEPNKFCRRVTLARKGERAFSPLPLGPGYTQLLRGAGVAETAAALAAGRAPLLDARRAAHVVEILDGIYAGAQSGRAVCLAPGLPPGPGPGFDPAACFGTEEEGEDRLCPDR